MYWIYFNQNYNWNYIAGIFEIKFALQVYSLKLILIVTFGFAYEIDRISTTGSWTLDVYGTKETDGSLVWNEAG